MWNNILKVFLNYDQNFEIISLDENQGLKIKDFRKENKVENILIWKDKEIDQFHLHVFNLEKSIKTTFTNSIQLAIILGVLEDKPT